MFGASGTGGCRHELEILYLDSFAICIVMCNIHIYWHFNVKQLLEDAIQTEIHNSFLSLTLALPMGLGCADLVGHPLLPKCWSRMSTKTRCETSLLLLHRIVL